MRRVIFSATIALFAIGAAAVTHANSSTKRLVTFYETPNDCNNIDCSTTNPPSVQCSSLTLFSDPGCNIPATNATGNRLDIP